MMIQKSKVKSQKSKVDTRKHHNFVPLFYILYSIFSILYPTFYILHSTFSTLYFSFHHLPYFRTLPAQQLPALLCFHPHLQNEYAQLKFVSIPAAFYL